MDWGITPVEPRSRPRGPRTPRHVPRSFSCSAAFPQTATSLRSTARRFFHSKPSHFRDHLSETFPSKRCSDTLIYELALMGSREDQVKYTLESTA